jgi:hypothetical protein
MSRTTALREYMRWLDSELAVMLRGLEHRINLAAAEDPRFDRAKADALAVKVRERIEFMRAEFGKEASR